MAKSSYRAQTKYIRLPELFSEFEAARIQGKYQQMLKQYRKYSLLILDEFLLIPTNDTEQRDLLELMEARCGATSTSALADSILDRVIPSAYIMAIGGDLSMRKRKRTIKD